MYEICLYLEFFHTLTQLKISFDPCHRYNDNQSEESNIICSAQLQYAHPFRIINVHTQVVVHALTTCVELCALALRHEFNSYKVMMTKKAKHCRVHTLERSHLSPLLNVF